MYQRIIPRDLFNESKLLKCLGQVALLIHEGKTGGKKLVLEHDDSDYSGFFIEQDPSDGGLYCSNLKLMYHGREIGLRSIYNNKDPFPMIFRDEDYAEYILFEDNGSFTPYFFEWLDTLD